MLNFILAIITYTLSITCLLIGTPLVVQCIQRDFKNFTFWEDEN